MNRRDFLQLGLGTAAALSLAPAGRAFGEPTPMTTDPLLLHRFGVDYTPSKNWYYCWNDFDPDATARDFDAIAALGADHVRVMLIWPDFQPNPQWVSEAHLARFDRLMGLAAERKLAVCPTLFNGWLSGYPFRPTFDEREKFYASDKMWDAAELYVRKVAAVATEHENFLGFDLGNEMNCYWATTDLALGDAWLERAFTLCETVAPHAPAHVEGADHQPWFAPTTFSARKLATRQRVIALHCWTKFTGALKHGGPLDAPCVRLGAAMSALARAYAGDPRKPTWVQEYGASSTWMDEHDIPTYVERATLAGVASGVSWHTWWASHDIDRKFRFAELEYGLGLLTVDNQPKDSARAFKAVADAHRGQPVKIPDGNTLPPLPERQTADATWQWLLDWMAQNA